VGLLCQTFAWCRTAKRVYIQMTLWGFKMQTSPKEKGSIFLVWKDQSLD
jgi:hypothetical protein